MSATGPTLAPNDPSHLLTRTTSPSQTASASDVLASSLFTCGEIHRIYCGSTGNLAIKRVNDAAFVVYPVLQGAYLDGVFIAVGGTGSGTGTGMTWIGEV